MIQVLFSNFQVIHLSIFHLLHFIIDFALDLFLLADPAQEFKLIFKISLSPEFFIQLVNLDQIFYFLFKKVNHLFLQFPIQLIIYIHFVIFLNNLLYFVIHLQSPIKWKFHSNHYVIHLLFFFKSLEFLDKRSPFLFLQSS